MLNSRVKLSLAAAVMALIAVPVAAKDAPVQLAHCDTNLGTVAVVEGDTQGWAEYGLGSPRELIAAMATESGCFTPHAGGNQPADFLMNVIAGSQEEVDQGMEMAKSAAIDGLVRSGAAGQILSKVPLGGAVLGMFGGLGGKKKTVAAGIRVISPASGATLASGSGTVKKSTLSLRGASGWQAGAAAAGYGGNKNGEMLTEAFMQAFNGIVAQQAILASAAVPAPAQMATAKVVVETMLYAAPDAGSQAVRSLRVGTELQPTGKREGKFLEASDHYGTTGWVSVEDLG